MNDRPTAECGIKTTPKNTYISLERHDLSYSDLQDLLSRDISWDSENFINIGLLCWKQKLQLSKLKSAILQLNTHYYRNCYTENANKTNFMHEIHLKFIWIITYGQLCTAICTNVTHESRLTLTELKNGNGLAQINAAIMQKVPGVQKAAIGHFNLAV